MFRPNTVGERAVRIDRYGVCEIIAVDERSTTVYVSSLGGGAPVVSGVDGANVYMKTLLEGSNITLDEAPNTITINATGGGGSGITTITSGAGDESLVQTGTAPTATLKALTAGDGIGLSSDANQITIDNTATIADSSVSGDESLVNTGTAPNYLLKRLAAGTGIVLSSDADVITIDNSGAGTTPTLTGLAGTESLVPGSPQVSFMLSVKSLNAGAGISLSSDANAVTITNSGVAQVYTLSDAAGATGQTLIAASAPTANDFRLYRILAGAGIIVSQSGGDVTITYSGAATAVTLASAGGSSLVTDGTGPDLAIKGVTTSDFVRLVTTGTTFTVDNRCMRVKGTDGNTPSQTVSDNATASGTPSAAYGAAASAVGNNSIAFGDASSAGAAGASAYGTNANASGANSVAAGKDSTSSGTSSGAWGRSATSSGNRSLASGYSSTASGSDAQARGYLSIASGDSAVADGREAQATGAYSAAYGRQIQSTGTRCVTYGMSDSSYVITNSVDNSACITLTKASNGVVPMLHTVFDGGNTTAVQGACCTIGRMVHAFSFDRLGDFGGAITTTPYALEAGRLISGTIHLTGRTGLEQLLMPTAAAIMAANGTVSSWWKPGMGFEFTILNTCGAAAALQSNPATTNISIVDRTNSVPVSPHNMPNNESHTFRMVMTSLPDNFDCMYLGSMTLNAP